MKTTRVVFCAGLMVLSLAVMAYAQQYSITDLGTVAGPYMNRNEAWAVNEVGQVAGWSSAFGFWTYDRAFRWDPAAGIRDLGSLSYDIFMHDAQAYDINELGQVVGWSHTGPSGAQGAFLWTQGGTQGPSWNPQMKSLGTLGGGNSRAFGVNDITSVVGIADTSAGQSHAFIWCDGTMADLDTLGGDWSGARRINNASQVVGTSLTAVGLERAFLWTPGATDGVPTNPQMKDLGHLGGGWSRGCGINDIGQVVGESYTSSATHAFLWETTQGMQDLGTLGGNSSIAYGVNSLGQVVGSAKMANGQNRAFIWNRGAMLDLNDYVPAGGGLTLEAATSINNRGQICGEAGSRAFVLTPLAELPLPQAVVLDWGEDAPVTVSRRRWFGRDRYIFSVSGSMPHASVSDNFRMQVLQQVQRIFADSGVYNVVVREGGRGDDASTVYFTVRPDPLWEIGGWSFTGIDRFNTTPSGGAVVFLPYLLHELDPEDRAEIIAHEVGHLLGLRHIRPSRYAEIMEQRKFDSDHEIFNNVVSPIWPDAQDFGTLHNPLYHLKRYVDGVEHDNLVSRGIMPGEWDIRLGQEHFCMDVRLRFSAADITLYDLNVLADRGEDIWEVIRHYDQISLSELSDASLTLPIGAMFQLVAASQEAGELDLVLATGDPYDPVNLSILPQEGEFSAFLQVQSTGLAGYDTVCDAWVAGTVVPEPTTMVLFLAAGTLMLAGTRRFRRRNSPSLIYCRKDQKRE